jgi:hypothetical protein
MADEAAYLPAGKGGTCMAGDQSINSQSIVCAADLAVQCRTGHQPGCSVDWLRSRLLPDGASLRRMCWFQESPSEPVWSIQSVELRKYLYYMELLVYI